MTPPCQPCFVYGRRFRARCLLGMSLLELLTVIVIVAILATMVAWQTRGAGRGYALRDSQSMVGSLFELARTQAAMTGAPVRLLIYDGNEAAQRWRKMSLIRQDNEGSWAQIHRILTLPDGVIWMPPADVEGPSVAEGLAERLKHSTFGHASSSEKRMQFSLPGVEPNASWFYYEFSPEGRAVAGGQIVLQSVRSLADQGFIVVDELSAGCRLRRSGVISYINSPQEFL